MQMDWTGFGPVASSLRTTRSTAELPAHSSLVGIEEFIKDVIGEEYKKELLAPPYFFLSSITAFISDTSVFLNVFWKMPSFCKHITVILNTPDST